MLGKKDDEEEEEEALPMFSRIFCAKGVSLKAWTGWDVASLDFARSKSL